jgi:hypothetical protein
MYTYNSPAVAVAVCLLAAANAVWQVYLEPEAGWRPVWEKGVMAAVVLGCLLLSLLVGILMASWAEQQRLLGDVLVRREGGSTCKDLVMSDRQLMGDQQAIKGQIKGETLMMMRETQACSNEVLGPR